MDEVFGDNNFVSLIQFRTASTKPTKTISNICDFILWYAKDGDSLKFREIFTEKVDIPDYERYDHNGDVISVGAARTRGIEINKACVFSLFHMPASVEQSKYPFSFNGRLLNPLNGWRVSESSMVRLNLAGRLLLLGSSLKYRKQLSDFACEKINATWLDMWAEQHKSYVVQTSTAVIERCIQMATDPGDLVLDPTCGSGTTAFVAEQWGRRWITIDTSRVALALARARIMGARYPFYLLADSREGQLKEAEVTRTAPSSQPVQGNIRHGFVYERVPHITLRDIASNVEIDVIWEKWQERLEPLRKEFNSAAKKRWQEWEVPREVDSEWSKDAKKLHQEWWDARIARQNEIDASISAKAKFEFLYDKPYEDKKRVRVAGPFTVESVSPHRTLASDDNDNPVDPAKKHESEDPEAKDFVEHILDNLKTAGVQQSDKKDKIDFTSITPWAGELVCADGRYMEGNKERRAAIFIGPEFGTVQRADLVAAAREAAEAGFDMLVACGFNFEAHATEFDKLGKIPVLKARMNADLHMSDELKNTGKGNLFVVFGEPDIEIKELKDDMIRVKIKGVDVFHPSTGEVRSDDTDGIACWFIDTDYNEESFFVRHAYFLGANDPYGALKTTLKAEVDPDAWESLHSDVSRAFEKPKSRRIAVKVINHLGDEVMKVFKV